MDRAHVHPVARFYSTLTAAPALLPGEDADHYQLIRDAVIREIDPLTAIEWLFVSGLVELSWDILRYRSQKVLEASRELSIQAMLERIDLAGIEEDDRPLACNISSKTSWQGKRPPSRDGN
jgi:hypothetical protein